MIDQACQLIFTSAPTTPATPLTLFSPDVMVTSLKEEGMETLVIRPINMSLVTNMTAGMRFIIPSWCYVTISLLHKTAWSKFNLAIADKNESSGLTGLTFIMTRNILPHLFLQYIPAGHFIRKLGHIKVESGLLTILSLFWKFILWPVTPDQCCWSSFVDTS